MKAYLLTEINRVVRSIDTYREDMETQRLRGNARFVENDRMMIEANSRLYRILLAKYAAL